MSLIEKENYSDPEIRRRMEELTSLTDSANKAWENNKLTLRAKEARMRLISADIVVKLRELREYAISTNNWVEDEETT